MQVFNNSEFGELGIMMIEDKPYFLATDCAKILSFAKPHNAISRHCHEVVKRGVTDRMGRVQERNFIPEGDLYKLVVRSKLPGVKRFEQWVFNELMPFIREHYNTSDTAKNLDIPREIPTDSSLQIFNNSEFGEIRAIDIEGEPWFVGRDVAEALGYQNTRDALGKHVFEEDKGVAQRDTLGGTQSMTIINESGLYALVFGSELPKAREFKHWVTSEVLPSIRKHGAYMTNEKLEQVMNDPDAWIDMMTKLKNERSLNARLQLEAEFNAPKVIFADAVTDSDCLILIGELAKILKGNGIEIGQNRLFAKLREDGYLIKRKGLDHNMPTQMAMELGLFMIEEKVLYQRGGLVVKTAKVTGKGQQYFVSRFLSEARAAAESVAYGGDVSYQFEQRSS